MIEIKFRGKRKLNGEWVYGSYIHIGDDWCQIIPLETSYDDLHLEMCRVISSTVGQFTGLLDKNKVEIYEGDIIEWTLIFKSDFGKPDKIVKTQYEVVYETNNIMNIVGFYFKDKNGKYVHFKNFIDIEIIGNVHQNPELLTDKQKTNQ